MSLLFQPMNIGTLALSNRIVIAPMCQYSAVDGVANEHHYVHLGRFPPGGHGLVVVDAAAGVPGGRLTASYTHLTLPTKDQR